MDIMQAPLSQVRVQRLAEEQYRIEWFVHHLVADGWSSAQVIGEVLALSNGQDPASLEIPKATYRQFVEWLAGRSDSTDFDFWRRELESVTPASTFRRATRKSR